MHAQLPNLYQLMFIDLERKTTCLPIVFKGQFFLSKEHFGSLYGRTIGWVGDGNNIIHSLMMAAPKFGIHLNIATPKVSYFFFQW